MTFSPSLQSNFLPHSSSRSLSTLHIAFLSRVSSWCLLWGICLLHWSSLHSPATLTLSSCIATSPLPPSPLPYTCLLIPSGALGVSAFLLSVLNATLLIAGPMRSRKGPHIFMYAGTEIVLVNAAFPSQMALNCWSLMGREAAGWRGNISFDSLTIFCSTMYNRTCFWKIDVLKYIFFFETCVESNILPIF